MKLLSTLLSLAILTFSLTASEIQLKSGWNLIGINSTDSVTILTSNPNIQKAAGGGVGGGGDFRFDKSFSQARNILQ